MRKAGAEDVNMAPAVGQGTYYLDSAEDVFRTIQKEIWFLLDLFSQLGKMQNLPSKLINDSLYNFVAQ